jgi:hypothetical protein
MQLRVERFEASVEATPPVSIQRQIRSSLLTYRLFYKQTILRRFHMTTTVRIPEDKRDTLKIIASIEKRFIRQKHTFEKMWTNWYYLKWANKSDRRKPRCPRALHINPAIK